MVLLVFDIQPYQPGYTASPRPEETAINIR